MSEWWTYKPSDFLLFSPHTYYRLFELYNADVWPLQIVALALGAVILALIHWNPPWQGRVISIILATCWLWVAWSYHLQRYAAINWAANYFAAGFVLQAALLIWSGVLRGRLHFHPTKPLLKRSGLGIFTFALVVQPFIAPLQGRDWMQAEIFGIAPDPTVIATLATLLLASKNSTWGLFIIPLTWCAISGTTLWTMKSPDAPVLTFAALLTIALTAWKAVYLRNL